MSKRCNGCTEVKPDASFNKCLDRLQGKCRSCQSEYHKQWEADNKDIRGEYKRNYRGENQEDIRAYQQKWTERNPDYFTDYYASNKHVRWRAKYLERAIRYGIEPLIEHFTQKEVLDKYGDECFYCDGGLFEELDHVVPVRVGGSHTLDNVRPSCARCNIRRWYAGRKVSITWSDPDEAA